MPFTITYGAANRIWGASNGTVTKNKASEAWDLVQKLAATDERVIIKDSSGRIVDWVELRAFAQRDVLDFEN